MKVAIVSPGFEPRRLRLQPHRTLLEMGRQLVALGHEVVLISDVASRLPLQDKVLGLPLRRVRSVRLFRGRHNPALLAAIAQESPDLLLWHLGLFSFIHQNLHPPFSQLTIGVLTSPVHRPREILRLGPVKLSSDLGLVATLLTSSLVPGVLIRHAFAAGGLRGVITLSETTRQHLIEKGAPAGRVWVVPPGVDPAWLDTCVGEEDRQNLRRQLGFDNGDFVVIYFGSPEPVRGLYTTLLAIEQAARSCSQLRLLILSRRWADELGRQTAHLNDLIERNGLKGRVRVVDGFLQQQELVRYVSAGDAVCLPFELVPSDVPLSILSWWGMIEASLSRPLR
jgi:glycosyltransferase involved in cell wall biosynthesis